MAKRVLGFFLFVCLGLSLCGLKVSAEFDLSDNLPVGASILQVLTHAGFDEDAANELLVLADYHGLWTVFLLESSSNGYETIFQTELGSADYLRKERIGETLAPLALGEINGDGLTDFWVVLASSERSRGEIRVYISSGGTYRSVAEVNADYDLQFADYQGEWVIHSVDREPQAETLRLRSFVWERERERFSLEEEDYRISIEDYRHFAFNRKRPQLFSGKNAGGRLKSRWCRSLLVMREVPRGRPALIALLPKKSYLLEFLPEQDLDEDVDTEYLIAYMLTDSTDARKVQLCAAIADWSMKERRYILKPLEGTFYGLARLAEGDFYHPIYLLKGNGLSHPVFIGNLEPDKPMIQLRIFANHGSGFALVESLQANYSVQLKEHSAGDGFYYQTVLGNLTKDGHVSVEVKRSVPDNVLGACGPFVPENDRIITVREFRRSYPAFEETEWIYGGYETSILRTNHKGVSAFSGPFPGSEKYRAIPEEFLGRNFVALNVRNYWPEDFNSDGVIEALALIKTDKNVWPPYYRLGYLRPTGEQLEMVSLGPPFQPGDEQPETGVYLADVNGDRIKEILTIRRGTNPETLRRGINLEILGFSNNQWLRLHAREIWYDDLYLSLDAGSLRLTGFLAQAPRKLQGTVYEFIWKSEGFHLEKKHSVNGFDAYLRRGGAEKNDFLKSNANVIRMW